MRCKRYCNANDISIEEFDNIKKENSNLIILDVRSPQEFKEGHIAGSTLIPSYEIIKSIRKVLPDKKTLIIVYCQNGGRSRNTVCKLKQMGYVNVYNLKYGLEGYIKNGNHTVLE